MRELKWRKNYFKFTMILFGVGFILYGFMGVVSSNELCQIWNLPNRGCAVAAAAFGGGYFFFSILSGILFTIHLIGRSHKSAKILFAIFFPIPIWLALAGAVYAIPYGIYNYYQIKKINKLNNDGDHDIVSYQGKTYRWEPLYCYAEDILYYFNEQFAMGIPAANLIIQYNGETHQLGLSSDCDRYSFFDTFYYFDDQKYATRNDFVRNVMLCGHHFTEIPGKLAILEVVEIGNPRKDKTLAKLERNK